MKKLALLLLTVCSCAALKPLPTQALDCLENGAPGDIAAVGTAIATKSYDGLTSDLLDLAWCVASSAYQDELTAKQIANANGVSTGTIQANAAVLLQAKGIALVKVPAPAHP